jgi:UDP-N-acetylglucosamine 3-dehydrogenase
MGRHHIRILGSMPDVELVGVVDVDAQRAALELTPSGTRTQVYPSRSPSCPRSTSRWSPCPPSTISTLRSPSSSEASTCLIEKPLASTPAEAERIVEAAEKAGVTLAVGHVERFNAAVNVLANLAEDP